MSPPIPSPFPDARHTDESPHISTFLTDQERMVLNIMPRVSDRFMHRTSLHAVHTDLRSGASCAALVSAACVHPRDQPYLRAMVRDFPQHPIVGVATPVHNQVLPTGAFLLGQSGVRQLIDVTRVGWDGLVRALPAPTSANTIWVGAFWTEVSHTLRTLVGEPRAEYHRFTTALFDPRVTTVGRLGNMFGLTAESLSERFRRAGLPTPKRYLSSARLVVVAWLTESPARTCHDVARAIGVSSPQMLCRTVQRYSGLSFDTFRAQYTGIARFRTFCDELIRPYGDAFQQFPRIVRPVW